MKIHEDKLLRACVVVEEGGRLWMVPKSRDGWQRRLPLTMTAQARGERLRPSRRIDAAALGIPVKCAD